MKYSIMDITILDKILSDSGWQKNSAISDEEILWFNSYFPETARIKKFGTDKFGLSFEKHRKP